MGNTLWSFGSNYFGGLGDDSTINRSSPVQTISGGSNWTSASCSSLTASAAIKEDGTLWLWGVNYNGNLGDNTTTAKSSPVQTVTNAKSWSQVSTGFLHAAAIKTNGTLWLWGAGGDGELGNNDTNDRSSPVQTICGGNNWSFVDCGRSHTAATKNDGTLWVWGLNYDGRLGTNTTDPVSSPVQTICGGTNWSKVACGSYHTAAIKTDGTLWMWGENYFGQLGTDDTIVYSSPVQTICGGTNWSKVACGYQYTAAIKTDGSLWMWGYNSEGQLGDNTTTDRSSPIQTITGGFDWFKVTCGYHTGAIKNDGTIWMWGYNNEGQLGTNDNIDKSSPIQTIMGGNKWTNISTGYYHTIALYAGSPTTSCTYEVCTTQGFVCSHKADISCFCVKSKMIRNAYVPAITVCSQNL